jgi:flagellar motor switch protein FliG
VALTGKQKAAMLLMNLDVTAASELLRGVKPELVEELAVEAAYLDAAGYRNSKENVEFAEQFYRSLQSKGEFKVKDFLKQMLKSTVGEQKAEQIQIQISRLLQKRDPFMSIRSADSKVLSSILEKEHPQAIAVVLTEMPTRKSSEILSLLHESVRVSCVRRMVSSEGVTIEAKGRIAEMVCRRLELISVERRAGEGAVEPTDSLRKVAVILRNLGKELRDGMLGAIKEKDSDAGKMVTDLMIVWEDIPEIADRSLQEALRGIEARVLALALVKADEAIAAKIKSNISERAAAAIEEESSLMSAPKKEDIQKAREEVLAKLREMNEKGELSFLEE